MSDIPAGKHESKWVHYVIPVGGDFSGGGSNMRFLFGESDPTQDAGQPGDVFLNTSSGDLFANENGTWNLKGNLKGPKGDKGEQGPEGPPGEQGPQGPPGQDAEPQFTQEQVDALLALIEDNNPDA